jgi:hypothetical protein
MQSYLVPYQCIPQPGDEQKMVFQVDSVGPFFSLSQRKISDHQSEFGIHCLKQWNTRYGGVAANSGKMGRKGKWITNIMMH